MSYRSNNQSKISDIEWTGNIPEHWQIKKVSELFEQRNEKVSDKDFEPLSVTKMGILKQLENVAKTDNNDNRKKVLKNDFVINSRSDRKGSCGVSEFDGSVSLICTVIKPKTNNTYMDYYHHLFRNKMFSEEFYRWGRGIVDDLWSTRWDEFKRILVPCPPFEEQKNIASFLNQIYKSIEDLIYKKEQQLITLQKYRLSLITETITRGLNQNEKLKDSGFDWIGKIPYNWEVKKFKYIKDAPMLYGATESGEPIQEGQPRYIRITDLTLDGELKNDDVKGLEPRKARPFLLEDGDILFARSGATVGKTFIYKEKYGPACFAGYMIKFSPDCRIIEPDFLYYFTKSSIFYFQVNEATTVATIQNVSAEKYLNFVTVLPPIEEQKEIANYIQEKTAEIDDALLNIQNQIETFKQYRNSLIYEAVTGKININDYNVSVLEVKL
ncbi:restriction endonuclease subunit S [Neobacillus vireti]|uniref:Restriction modification system DNA specificity domain-containing protein n=1 Tax=Neobacillus vireti LMG 21834 TaxID=1131730 RepID=A0AB94ILD2_9BACI|nr:restriction endonuclease subunit S [Neobacillus vireti]ETI67875.1 restriction modification system DNA specificity domain-containing protein [Neobacillus vireti LMG 21834]KLT17302.1 restriction endonuclease subunit S [Neobacillus vireti]